MSTSVGALWLHRALPEGRFGWKTQSPGTSKGGKVGSQTPARIPVISTECDWLEKQIPVTSKGEDELPKPCTDPVLTGGWEELAQLRARAEVLGFAPFLTSGLSQAHPLLPTRQSQRKGSTLPLIALEGDPESIHSPGKELLAKRKPAGCAGRGDFVPVPAAGFQISVHSVRVLCPSSGTTQPRGCSAELPNPGKNPQAEH